MKQINQTFFDHARQRPGTIVLPMVLPWVVLWMFAHTSWVRRIADFVFSDAGKLPQWVVNLFHSGPIIIFLLAGLGVAWKRKCPIWSYPWIGLLFFMIYRELFSVVLISFPKLFAVRSDLAVQIFYYGFVPLALVALLMVVSRRDWLLGCLTIYPYTSLLMPWYTLDVTPALILLVSFLIYVGFLYLFLKVESRRFKFITLLIGTIVLTAGFFAWLGEWESCLVCTARNGLIILFPAVLSVSPRFRRNID